MKIIPTTVTRSIGAQKLNLQAKSPGIMFVGGLASILTGTVLACRATLKVHPTLDKFKEDVEQIKEAQESTDYKHDTRKDMAVVYAINTGSLLKLYGPALVFTATGITLLTKSHTTLASRNASLAAAYTVVSEAFDAYRTRVRDEVGVDKETDLYYGRKLVVSNDDDNSAPVEGYAVDVNGSSPYACFFDESSTSFQKNPELNRLFIQCQQNYANDRLTAYGHVFLNEVLDWLGLPRTSAGAVVGWIKNSDRGDNYIDFNMFAAKNEDFLYGVEPRILLDFNVDGMMYDQIGGR